MQTAHTDPARSPYRPGTIVDLDPTAVRGALMQLPDPFHASQLSELLPEADSSHVRHLLRTLREVAVVDWFDEPKPCAPGTFSLNPHEERRLTSNWQAVLHHAITPDHRYVSRPRTQKRFIEQQFLLGKFAHSEDDFRAMVAGLLAEYGGTFDVEQLVRVWRHQRSHQEGEA